MICTWSKRRRWSERTRSFCRNSSKSIEPLRSASKYLKSDRISSGEKLRPVSRIAFVNSATLSVLLLSSSMMRNLRWMPMMPAAPRPTRFVRRRSIRSATRASWIGAAAEALPPAMMSESDRPPAAFVGAAAKGWEATTAFKLATFFGASETTAVATGFDPDVSLKASENEERKVALPDLRSCALAAEA